MVWPIPFLINMFTALKGSQFNFYLIFSGPVSSFLIDRFSCRTAMIISGILVALGFVGTAFAPNIYVAIITFGLVAGKFCQILRAKNTTEPVFKRLAWNKWV